MESISFNRLYSPSLLFIETTKACDYACRHCRAESQLEPSPDELDAERIIDVIDYVKNEMKPIPEIIFTGGNIVMKRGIEDIIAHTSESGIPFAVSPAGSPLVTGSFLTFLHDHGVSSISLSIDGMNNTHDWLRKMNGSFDLTSSIARKAIKLGIEVQINTTVFKRNIAELTEIAYAVKELGASAWEVFFLIQMGRGTQIVPVGKSEYMQINSWLADLSGYGLNVRTVESPIFRVIKSVRKLQPELVTGDLYNNLTSGTQELFGTQTGEDGEKRQAEAKPGGKFRGTLFISYNGDVFPNGFTPVRLGNVTSESLANILGRNTELLNSRESGMIEGKCGKCNFTKICGGSRARAFNVTGNPFAEDPNCLYAPTGSGKGVS